MDAAIASHMAQLRTLRGAARDLGCHHQIITRRIRDGSLDSWRVDGVVLVRLDQAKVALARVSGEPLLSLADVPTQHPALAHVDPDMVAKAHAWILGHLRPIKAFSANTSASTLAELIHADTALEVGTDEVVTAALLGGYRLRTFHGRLLADPFVAVSAADVHAVQRATLLREAAARRTGAEWLG